MCVININHHLKLKRQLILTHSICESNEKLRFESVIQVNIISIEEIICNRYLGAIIIKCGMEIMSEFHQRYEKYVYHNVNIIFVYFEYSRRLIESHRQSVEETP